MYHLHHLGSASLVKHGTCVTNLHLRIFQANRRLSIYYLNKNYIFFLFLSLILNYVLYYI
jgi:hypothetical protein